MHYVTILLVSVKQTQNDKHSLCTLFKAFSTLTYCNRTPLWSWRPAVRLDSEARRRIFVPILWLHWFVRPCIVRLCMDVDKLANFEKWFLLCPCTDLLFLLAMIHKISDEMSSLSVEIFIVLGQKHVFILNWYWRIYHKSFREKLSFLLGSILFTK